MSDDDTHDRFVAAMLKLYPRPDGGAYLTPLALALGIRKQNVTQMMAGRRPVHPKLLEWLEARVAGKPVGQFPEGWKSRPGKHPDQLYFGKRLSDRPDN